MRRRTVFLSTLPLGAAAWLVAAGPALGGPADGADRPVQANPSVELRVEAQLGGDVAGVAADGARVYAGVGPRVVVLDASGDGDPLEVATSDLLPGDVTALAIQDGLVYAGYGVRNEGDPNGLVVLGGRAVGLAPELGRLALLGVPVGVWARGETLLVATRLQVEDSRPHPTPSLPLRSRLGPAAMPDITTYHGGEVLTVDASDPAALRVVGRMAMPEVPVALQGAAGRAFVLAADPTQGRELPAVLVALDVSDVTAPRRVGALSLGGSVRLGGGLELDGGYAYASAGFIDPGLAVVDVTEPGHMRVLASVQAMGGDVALAGHYLYVLDTPEAFVLDVGDPARPQRVGRLDGYYSRLAVAGDRLVAAETVMDRDGPMIGNRAAVTVLAATSDPSAPRKLGRWTSVVDVTSVAADGERLYANVGENLFVTIDASDPRRPRPVASTAWNDGWSLSGTQLAVGAGFLAMTQPSGIPSSVAVAGLGPLQAPAAWLRLDAHAVGVAATGPLAVVAVEPAEIPFQPPPLPQPADSALRVFDASDPAHPRLVGAALLDERPVGVAAVPGALAYVATRSDLRVLDLSQPELPRLVRSLPGVAGKGTYEERGVAVGGGRLAVAVRDGVRLFDLAVPDDPQDAGHVRAEEVTEIALTDDWLLTLSLDAQRRGVVMAYELGALGAGPAARFEPPSAAVTMAVQGGLLAVATRDSGIYWLRPVPIEPRPQYPVSIWLPALLDVAP